MDRTKTRLIAEAAEKALADVAAQFDCEVKYKGGTYDTLNTVIKFEFAEKDESGVTMTKEATDFQRYASRYGMTAEDLGETVVSGVEKLTIVGCKPRSTKYPILVRKEDGRVFKYQAETIRMLLNIKRNVEGQ